jgi:hypothetical protein|tara:strand:- start:380 stop:559 length:180 start_codon:yes stop_codon:yes gene_type:complete
MVISKLWLARQAMTEEQREILDKYGMKQVLIDQAIANGEIKTDDSDEIDAWVQENILDI